MAAASTIRVEGHTHHGGLWTAQNGDWRLEIESTPGLFSTPARAPQAIEDQGENTSFLHRSGGGLGALNQLSKGRPRPYLESAFVRPQRPPAGGLKPFGHPPRFDHGRGKALVPRLRHERDRRTRAARRARRP